MEVMHTCMMEVFCLTVWGFIARSPAGLQHAQRHARLYYKPVNNSVLDGLLKELIYPGLFANLGYKAQLWLRRAEPLLLRCPGEVCPSASLLVPGGGADGVRRCLAWKGWGPRGVPVGIPLLVSPGWGTQHPLPNCGLPGGPHSCKGVPAKPRGSAWAPALPGHPQVAELPRGTTSGTIFKNTY